MLPYFVKTETNLNKYSLDEDYHGAMGEQYVSWLPYLDEPASMMTEAFTEAGVPYGDFNGASQFAGMQAQVTAADGERMSTNRVFIGPIRYKRNNLVIKTHSVATKIIFDEHKRARGVEYVRNGKKYRAYAKKEVIVSGGVVESPKLLMLSGIGPKEHLESLNIPVVQNLAVGENLQDHVAFNGLIIALSNETATTVSHEQMLRDIKEFATLKHKRVSPLAGLGPIMSAAFIKTDECLVAPNMQLQANHIPDWREYIKDPVMGEKAAIWPTSYYNGMIPRIMNLTPKSRGKILLNEDDPLGPPKIHVNYLGDERDIEPLLKGIKFMLSLEDTEAFKSRGAYYVREQFPHCTEHEWGTDEYFVCLIRQYTSCTHHQVGTCKMGPRRDKKAVVDSELRVYGVKSLRVIDASVMPVVIRGNTNAPTIMIAEKAIEGVIKYWQKRTNNYCF